MQQRWLLLTLDRLDGNELVMTHELIAQVLGVRREGVTEAAFNLQAAGVIRDARGHISVLDRHALEQRSCECCRIVGAEYDRLLPSSDPDGAGGPRSPPRARAPRAAAPAVEAAFCALAYRPRVRSGSVWGLAHFAVPPERHAWTRADPPVPLFDTHAGFDMTSPSRIGRGRHSGRRATGLRARGPAPSTSP